MLNTFASLIVNSVKSRLVGKIIYLILIVHCTLTIENCLSQSQFQRTIGGTDGDLARSIIRTTDGGYAVAGRTLSFGAGNFDFYIVKLDGSGTLQWSKTLGGTFDDDTYSIIQTTDGGYAVAGYTLSFGAGQQSNFYIVKLDGSGTLQWSRTFGGTGNDQDDAHSIIQTTDGGYAVAGYTGSFGAGYYDFYIVKLDTSGTLQWSRTVGGTGGDLARSIIRTTDGGYAVAGYTSSFGAGGYDMYIVKLDAGGTLEWSRTVGGTGDDRAYSMIQTTDGGYAVAGYTESFGAGYYDFYIVKLNSSGTLQWSKTVGGTGLEIANSIVQTTDGGYAAAGSTNSFGAGGDMYIVKLNGSGTVQWSRTIGGTSSDGAGYIVQTTDGGYAAAGSTNSFGAGQLDLYIVKLDSSGNTCGNSTSPPSISGSGGTLGTSTPTVTTPTSTVTTPTSLTSTGGTVTNVCTMVGVVGQQNEIPEVFRLEQNYPNPFNPNTKIQFALPKSSFAKLVVYDALGRELETILNEHLNAGTYEADFDGSNFASGIYFYVLKTESFTDTKRMILIK